MQWWRNYWGGQRRPLQRWSSNTLLTHLIWVCAWRPSLWCGSILSDTSYMSSHQAFYTGMNFIGMLTDHKCRGSGYKNTLLETGLVTSGSLNSIQGQSIQQSSFLPQDSGWRAGAAPYMVLGQLPQDKKRIYCILFCQYLYTYYIHIINILHSKYLLAKSSWNYIKQL